MQHKQQQYFTPPSQYAFWKQQVVPCLKQLQQKAIPPKDIRVCLSKLHQLNAPPKESGYHNSSHQKDSEGYSLRYLELLGEQELTDLLSRLAEFLLNFTTNRPIQLLRIERRRSVQYERKTLFYLVVLMFFGLVRRTQQEEYQYKRFNNMTSFAHILSNSQFKTTCILHYLQETLRQIAKQQTTVSFIVRRNIIKQTVGQLVNHHRHKKLAPLKILDDSASIEDFNGEVKVDFANRFIGGGCLRNGCVQEEIMFAVRPQLYALTLLCEEMESNEAIFFTGFRRRYNSKGYGDRTAYDGKCLAEYTYQTMQKDMIYNEEIVAIDATKFPKFQPKQYSQSSIARELRKAVAGFSMYENRSIVSGGWGCGVYNGDFELKLMIQWMAATMTDNRLLICPFGRRKQILRNDLIDRMKDYGLEEVYGLVIEAADKRRFVKDGIFQIMLDLIK